ncbi:MAG: mechanosensitive ion channel family protein [Acidimicrobiia bacterium]|nr:mechanosensitive ion channel family protein [Acidimicrobiia bacterium]
MTTPLLADLFDACGAEPGFVCERVYDATNSKFWTEVVEWVVEKPLTALAIFAVAWLINRAVRRAIDRAVGGMISRSASQQAEREGEISRGPLAALHDRATAKMDDLRLHRERREQRAETVGTVLRSLATAVIYSLAVLIVLAEFNLNLGPLVAGAGIVGVALGFGAQSIVRDFLAGIFMIVEDQYGVGDIVDFGEATGVVEAVSLRTTRLRDVEGVVWFVPNGEIHRIGNKSQLWSRAVLDIEVAYDTDLGHAAEVIKSVADSVWEERLEYATIISEPEIWGVQEFGSSAIAIRLVIQTEPGEQFAAAREIRGRLKPAFDAGGIDIPFPQRVVWNRSEGPGSVPGSVLHAGRPKEQMPEAT